MARRSPAGRMELVHPRPGDGGAGGKAPGVTANPACPPPAFLFQEDPEQLSRIRAQITTPPDPRVLPWTPPPDYDPQTVAVRIRLDRSAAARVSEPAEPVRQPTRIESAFARQTGAVTVPAPQRGLFQLDDRPESGAAPAHREVPPVSPEDEAPAGSGFVFGVAQGAYRRKKDAAEDKTKARPRRRTEEEDDLQERLKKRFL